MTQAPSTPQVVFACIRNGGRSVISRVLTEHYAGGRVRALRPAPSPASTSSRGRRGAGEARPRHLARAPHAPDPRHHRRQRRRDHPGLRRGVPLRARCDDVDWPVADPAARTRRPCAHHRRHRRPGPGAARRARARPRPAAVRPRPGLTGRPPTTRDTPRRAIPALGRRAHVGPTPQCARTPSRRDRVGSLTLSLRGRALSRSRRGPARSSGPTGRTGPPPGRAPSSPPSRPR